MTKKLQLFSDAKPEIQHIIKRVLKAEMDRLSDPKPRGIRDEVEKIIKEEIR